MTDLPYQQAFDRIRADTREMPGMRLTATQVQRLSGVDISVCKVVLEDLVRAQFLYLDPDGSYSMAVEERRHSRVPKAERNATVIQSSRRAS